MRGLIFILLSLAVFLPLVEPKKAVALSVSPLVYTYEAKPGDQINAVITLRNETEESVTYIPTVQDFVADDDESGTPKFVEQGQAVKTSLTSWIVLSAESLNLEPFEKKQFSLTISIPTETHGGGYYGGLLFGSNAPATTDSAALNQKVGVLLLVAVAGSVKESAELVSFEGPAKIVSHLPATFTTRIINTGDTFLQPHGVIEISNMLSAESATIPFNPESSNILPSSTRRFTSTWQNTEVAANTPELVKEWKNFGFGRYTAHLAAQYGSAGTILNESVSFWVIPWQMLTVGAVIILVLFVLTRQKSKQQ